MPTEHSRLSQTGLGNPALEACSVDTLVSVRGYSNQNAVNQETGDDAIAGLHCIAD
jgi:hypothetical protein